MQTVTVLLTKYSDWISWIIYHIGGRGYTHASISLKENSDCFYSFNYRGFCIETLAKHKRRGVKKSLCYELQISEKSYEEMQKRIRDFEERRADFHYTRLGLLFAVLKIPMQWKNHYICSQFVAELLNDTGAVPLKKKTSTYLPNCFCKELEQYTGLKAILYNVI